MLLPKELGAMERGSVMMQAIRSSISATISTTTVIISVSSRAGLLYITNLILPLDYAEYSRTELMNSILNIRIRINITGCNTEWKTMFMKNKETVVSEVMRRVKMIWCFIRLCCLRFAVSSDGGRLFVLTFRVISVLINWDLSLPLTRVSSAISRQL